MTKPVSERCRGPAEKVIVYRSRTEIDDNCGAEGDRTLDLVNAIHALSQLSYSPMGKFHNKYTKNPYMSQ